MIVAAIPTKDRADLAYTLAKHLIEHEGCYVVVADNGAPRDPMIDLEHLMFDTGMGRVLPARDRTLQGRIYRLWNMLWDLAINAAPWPAPLEICFINDDAWPAPGALREMSKWLRDLPDAGIVYPDYDVPATTDPTLLCAPFAHQTAGSYRHGGMSGWCFMVPAELEVRFDESFEWWCGDDDFAFQVARAGLGQYRIGAVGCDHLGEATAVHNPWTEDAKGRDLERLHAKWGDT